MKTFAGNAPDTVLSQWTCLWLSALLVLVGCASPSPTFQSKKAPSYERKLEKVLLIYKSQTNDKYDVVGHQLGADFSERLAQQVKALLEQKSVPCELVCLKDELDIDGPIKEAAARFGSKQQLGFWVKYIGGARMINRVRQNNTVVLSLSLWDSRVGKAVWHTEATFVDFSPRDQDAAKEIVQELVNAGLL